MFMRLTFVFYLPLIAYNQSRLKVMKNPLHDGKRELSGIKKIASCKEFAFLDIKYTSKKMKCTINDLMTGCLSASMKEYFESQGDKETDRINLIIPANIRFKMYDSPENLKLENKFAPFNLCLPLYSGVEKAC